MGKGSDANAIEARPANSVIPPPVIVAVPHVLVVKFMFVSLRMHGLSSVESTLTNAAFSRGPLA